MYQEPAEKREIGDHFREKNGAVVAGCIWRPAVLGEDLKERDLLVWWGCQDAGWSAAGNRRAHGKQVAHDVDIARTQGQVQAVVQEGLRARLG